MAHLRAPGLAPQPSAHPASLSGIPDPPKPSARGLSKPNSDLSASLQPCRPPLPRPPRRTRVNRRLIRSSGSSASATVSLCPAGPADTASTLPTRLAPMLRRSADDACAGSNAIAATHATTAPNGETPHHVRTQLQATVRRARPALAPPLLQMTCKTALTVLKDWFFL